MPFKALSRFSLYVGLLLGFVLVFCPPLGMPPAISSNLFCWTIRAIIYTHQRAAGEARASVCACTHPRASPSYTWMQANVLPSITDTDIQTHNHSRSRALSRQYSTRPRFKASEESEERHVCVRVCMHGITPSIPPLPLSRTRTSDTPDTPRPAQAHLIPSILFVRNAAPTFPNSCRSSLYRYIDA